PLFGLCCCVGLAGCELLSHRAARSRSNRSFSSATLLTPRSHTRRRRLSRRQFILRVMCSLLMRRSEQTKNRPSADCASGGLLPSTEGVVLHAIPIRPRPVHISTG